MPIGYWSNGYWSNGETLLTFTLFQEQEEYAKKGINLDPNLYLVKLMVGGIDRSYDEGDEG